MTQAASPQQRLNQLLALKNRLEAEIRATAERVTTTPRRRRSKFEIPPCGTETGYQRHRYRRETCDQCKAAHALNWHIKNHRNREVA